MVLGYTLDLRNHPIRWLLHHGLQVSISSDDPGFFNYEGVTLDYAYVVLAWELDLMDLKKLSLNGIKYSSAPEAVKTNLTENIFPQKWAEFVAMLKDI
jgi:adenosine deaminase CECR1